MELSSKEPELMGMGKKLPNHVRNAAVKQHPEPISEEAAAQTTDTSESEVIQACSGLAMKRI